MAVARKSGNKLPQANVGKSGLLSRKPVRRRAPLRANAPTSSVSLNQQPTQSAYVPNAIADNGVMNPMSPQSRNIAQSNQKTDSFPVKRKPLQKTLGKNNQSTKANAIPVMPGSEQLPFWLRKYQQLQRYTSIFTFALVSATLSVYALNVYSQQSWGQAYKKLQHLQRNEQQLTTKNEVLKNKIAGEAEKPSTGLVNANPNQAIFIPPASSSPSPANIEPQPTPQLISPSTNNNGGY